ncbi:putative transcriptional regulator [Candidatus Nitrososphaera evergladensis SR1]|jgi:ArsR family transcriptional regulator|uniref:Putative transcriptional regulator n=2 Tax=Nitrososphaera TaxID=497726 RepID=A0A075MLR4_9ARCH|nr:putative transcriptional regulator [Candidatus Nitrososphaera evergladensis SR1]
MDSDIILDILGNETRRKILATLSQEPMYFNQLAKELDIGQQAVLRHLQALEESGLVETYTEKSKLGAPDRKYYRLNNSFILTISLSEDDFTVTKQEIVESRHKESKKYYKVLDLMPEDAGEALASLQESLSDIEAEMSALESRLSDLRALKQLILSKLHKIGINSFEEDERKILYKIVTESPSSIAELSEMMDEKESRLKTTISAMRNKMNKDNAKTLLDLQ